MFLFCPKSRQLNFLFLILFGTVSLNSRIAPANEEKTSAFEWSFTYKGEWSRVNKGGLHQRTTYIDNIDLRLGFDAEKALSWEGLSFYAQGLANSGADYGQAPFLNVGDMQGTSNIATRVNAAKLYAAWVQKNFFEGRYSVLFGLHDLNSEFYATDSSGLFLNASFGVGTEIAQTGVNGPSIFPTTAPALRLRARPQTDSYLQTAIFNAQAGDPQHPSATVIRANVDDGLLWITEGGLNPEVDGLKRKYALGAWTYTRRFDDLRDGTPQPSNGLYLLLDQALTPGFSWFFRHGMASAATNNLRRNTSTGMVFTGLVPHREKDRLGFAATQVEATEAFLESMGAAGTAAKKRTEEAYEISYRLEIMPGFALQPDWQYIVHGLNTDDVGDAEVTSLRFEVSF